MKEKLKLEYYFSKTTEFMPEYFSKYSTTYDAMLNLDSYVDELTKDDPTGAIIGEGTIIHDNVVIERPVVIGKNVEIMAHAYIRPYSVIGDNAVIGHAAEIKHSIIFPGAKVQSFTFAGDSIIGYCSRVGSGSIMSNRRFDQGEIGIKIDGEYQSFNRKFFGVVLGDNSRIGASCSCFPGTHIGKYTWIFPSNSVKGFIPSEVRVNGTEVTKNKKIELES